MISGARRWALELAVVLVSAFATAVVVTLAPEELAFDRPALHTMLETIAGMTAGIVTVLVYGRFRRSRRRDDLLLAASLMCLSISHLAFATAPEALVDEDSRAFAMWATVPANALSAVLFVAAALSGARRARVREGMVVLGGSAVALAAIGAAALLVAADLPRTVTAAGPPGRPDLHGHGIVLGLQALGIVLYVIAGTRFARRAHRERDAFLRWLGVAAILAGFARVHYLLYPTLYTEYVASGDVFRFVVHVVLLTAAAREIRRYWQELAAGAVLAERRRIARDLHDGVAQELAYIMRRANRMADADEAGAAPIAASARRALEDSRRAIHALARGPDETLDVAIAAAVRTAASGSSAVVRLDLQPGVHAPSASCDALVRIACEAIANAANHGSPSAIDVSLRNGDGIRLCVRDDGVGFDPDAPTPAKGRGFGLTGMRDRASGVGGELTVRSRVGGGTEVEAVIK